MPQTATDAARIENTSQPASVHPSMSWASARFRAASATTSTAASRVGNTITAATAQ